MDEKEGASISYATANVARRPLKFNPMEHSILLSELKHLYTALTRARCRIIVFDEDHQKRAPMFELFERSGLMKVTTIEEEGSQEVFAVQTSSAADWYLQGTVLEENQHYSQAAMCYARPPRDRRGPA